MKGLVAILYLSVAIAANGALADAVPDALRVGDMKKLNVHADPKPAGDAAFVDAEGVEHRLSDWKGKHVLVNFWATWCAPCRKEMPALNALQAQMGGEDFEVVTIATGRNTVEGIGRFFADEGVTRLPVLLDPTQALARQMSVLGLPVTVLLDPEGREVARLLGDADWNGPEARALLEAMTGG
ncbi:thiol:disulfide interChange protein TlpA [Oceaniovalibus guishaninsula JLT2003]|uniref:Thiol:disulfide interChange protein TlpA n=1 Tax=Oceaniovalibus guishaninsula JLT2003 TaxID=1231392 RepID=K2H979_9RHOB|nr:TlpA disulfide reductase family protein [Oceaniovalibus guishaninsula]EKE44118.1 thiol:disulfide interChange protein TlpA [Oceaniovalibus guishaninsula JLT2003]